MRINAHVQKNFTGGLVVVVYTCAEVLDDESTRTACNFGATLVLLDYLLLVLLTVMGR